MRLFRGEAFVIIVSGRGIESDTNEILAKLEKRHYPFDGSWLDWMPDPDWMPPKLPENWDKI